MGAAAEAVNIREMQEKDLDAVALMEREAFADAWKVSMLTEELANPLSTYLVLEADGEPAGYAGIWLVAGEAQITRVAVHPKYRGRGWGVLLTQALVQRAWELGAEAITLEVRETNHIAQRAYLRSGFTSAGVRPGYYEDTHEGAVIMWLYK